MATKIMCTYSSNKWFGNRFSISINPSSFYPKTRFLPIRNSNKRKKISCNVDFMKNQISSKREIFARPHLPLAFADEIRLCLGTENFTILAFDNVACRAFSKFFSPPQLLPPRPLFVSLCEAQFRQSLKI